MMLLCVQSPTTVSLYHQPPRRPVTAQRAFLAPPTVEDAVAAAVARAKGNRSRNSGPYASVTKPAHNDPRAATHVPLSSGRYSSSSSTAPPFTASSLSG